MRYRAILSLGWDKSRSRKFMTERECNRWLDMMCARYLGTEVISARVVGCRK